MKHLVSLVALHTAAFGHADAVPVVTVDGGLRVNLSDFLANPDKWSLDEGQEHLISGEHVNGHGPLTDDMRATLAADLTVDSSISGDGHVTNDTNAPPAPQATETPPVVPQATETPPVVPQATETPPVVPVEGQTPPVVPVEGQTPPPAPQVTETPPPAPQVTETPPVVPVVPAVIKEGRKYFVVNQTNGERLSDYEAEKGYTTEAKAWDAITAAAIAKAAS